LLREGFPEFTRFFNPPFGEKLRFSVNLKILARFHSHLLYQLSYPGIAGSLAKRGALVN
jgi:hypothetical protein